MMASRIEGLHCTLQCEGLPADNHLNIKMVKALGISPR